MGTILQTRKPKSTILADEVDNLARVRTAIKVLEKEETELTEKFRKLLMEDVVVESDSHYAELAKEETPSQKYDVAKAYKVMTKAQLIALCSVSASKLKVLVDKGEVTPVTEQSLRVGTPTQKARKVLLKNKE
jgi:hypothetical protein